MIFAKLNYSEPYENLHDRLTAHLEKHFAMVESGLQGDSWICVSTAGGKVAVDTFTAMFHEVNSKRPGTHVDEVIGVLCQKFSFELLPEPELEPHE